MLNFTSKLTCFAVAIVLCGANAAHAGLIGHWTFDDTYTDLAQGNDAFTNSGSPAFDTDAAAGSHSLLVGVSDDAAALVSNLPAGASPRTMSFWMKADSTQDEAPVSWGTKDVNLHLFEALVRSNSTVVGHFWGAGNDTIGSAEVVYPTSTWVHVAMTYDGSTVRVFGNGALAGSKVLALDTTPGAGNSLNPIFFGGGNTFFSSFATDYSGRIDDVQIYDNALTAGQISFLFNNPGSSIVPEPSSVVLWGMVGLIGLGYGIRRRKRSSP